MQTVIDFTIISFSIFVAIKLLYLLKKEEAKEIAPTREELLLMEIRDLLRAQKNHLER